MTAVEVVAQWVRKDGRTLILNTDGRLFDKPLRAVLKSSAERRRGFRSYVCCRIGIRVGRHRAANYVPTNEGGTDGRDDSPEAGYHGGTPRQRGCRQEAHRWRLHQAGCLSKVAESAASPLPPSATTSTSSTGMRSRPGLPGRRLPLPGLPAPPLPALRKAPSGLASTLSMATVKPSTLRSRSFRPRSRSLTRSGIGSSLPQRLSASPSRSPRRSPPGSLSPSRPALYRSAAIGRSPKTYPSAGSRRPGKPGLLLLVESPRRVDFRTA